MQPNLNQLMASTAEGDKRAFRQLAAALNGLLYAEGIRILRGHADMVEDAAQEALISLWRNAPRWSGQGSVEAYARTIMRNACIDILRTRQRRREDDMEIADVVEFSVGPEAETTHDLGRSLDELDTRQRRAALMFYGAGYEQKEIANDMGISEKAVERMLAYARHKLRKFRERDET